MISHDISRNISYQQSQLPTSGESSLNRSHSYSSSMVPNCGNDWREISGRCATPTLKLSHQLHSKIFGWNKKTAVCASRFANLPCMFQSNSDVNPWKSRNIPYVFKNPKELPICPSALPWTPGSEPNLAGGMWTGETSFSCLGIQDLCGLSVLCRFGDCPGSRYPFVLSSISHVSHVWHQNVYYIYTWVHVYDVCINLIDWLQVYFELATSRFPGSVQSTVTPIIPETSLVADHQFTARVLTISKQSCWGWNLPKKSSSTPAKLVLTQIPFENPL